MGREATAVAVVERDGHTLALVEGGRDRVGESPPSRIGRGQAIHDHEDLSCLAHPRLGVGRVEPGEHAVELGPHEPCRAELCRHLHVRPVRARGQWEGHQDGKGRSMLRPDVDQFVHDFLHRVDFHDAPAPHAVLGAGARPQEPQEIVDLRGRADRRAAARRRVLLLDGDRRRDALDRVDQRFGHPLEELLRIRRERLDVAALPLGVEGIERQRALARPRRPGDDGEGASRQLDRDPLEIVLPGVADDHAVG